jgi:DNA-binding transcriptional LysR family regulator
MTHIDGTDLRDVDLNLFVAFEALMQTRSVTKAAERLRVGQPSASHALKRLRALLDDPLFVKTPGGMTPTPRALALAEPIRSILTTIETTLFAGPSFDPPRATRIFRMGATDYAQSVIADPLLFVLRKDAPGCRLILTATDCDIVGRSLERGEIDLAVGAFPEVVSATHQRVLYRERYACVFDAEACGVKGTVSRAQWLALPHIIMSTRGDCYGPLDEVIRAFGERRDVVASTPNFLAIPFLLKGKRIMSALPARLARTCRTTLGLATCVLPFDAPEFDVTMVWNARTANEPGALWLRDQIVSISASLSDRCER